MGRRAFSLLLFLASPAVRAAEAPAPSVIGGGTFSLGSRGYWRLGGALDLAWRGAELDPYAWAAAGGGSDGSDMSLGGGAWRSLSEGLRARGGLGLAFGRLRDAERTTTSVILEAGAERDWSGRTWGGDLRFTTGALPDSRSAVGLPKKQRGRGTGAAAEVRRSYSVAELAGSVSQPLGAATAGLELAVAFPSYSGPLFSQTARVSFPLRGALRGRAGLTLEESAQVSLYASTGLSYSFR